MMGMADCTIAINTGLPLSQPYRTGAYLIYDYPAGTSDDHFRRGDDSKLGPNTFRASGSRQLDAAPLAVRLGQVAKVVQQGGRLHLVDLRQESHLFFDRRAVSWYADKDWVNVGQSLDWITGDEQSQLARIAKFPRTQVFCLDPANKEFARPTGCSNVTVTSSATEAAIAQQMAVGVPVNYLRLPVTDHCPPPTIAVGLFVAWCMNTFAPGDWVHLHCHGGDGRTTTFMCLFDMVTWVMRRGPVNFPTIQQFADRQRLLFAYNLNPGACNPATDWKCALAMQRWQVLGEVRDALAAGRIEQLTSTGAV
jgi:hypothetical protein